MTTAAVAPAVDLGKTKDCVFISTHFHMGIGRMRQIRDLEVWTTADKSQLRHQKQLIDSPELDEIRSQDRQLISHLNSRSCKYSDSMRLLPKSEVEKMYKIVEAYRTIRRPKLVAKFMEKYRELEAIDFEPLSRPAPYGLGDQFKRSDYPPSSEVEAGFYFEYELREVGKVAIDGVPAFIVEAELKKDAEKREAAVIEWRETLRFAGVEVVNALFDAVKPQPDGKKRKLFDSAVDNLQEFLSTFNLRDLAGDAEYQTKVVVPLQKLMKGVTMDKIRHSDNLKEHIAKEVAEIRKSASLLVQATGRKFR